MQLDVYFTPCEVTDEALRGSLAVVIDVLRATTTITTALSAGARSIRPVASLGDVEDLASGTRNPDWLRAGERDGEKIAGFDLGNSPREYTESKVEGKTIVLTTTNGTKALTRADPADETIVASMLNAGRVANYVAERQSETILLCAGRHNRPALEDSLCAGLIASHLVNSGTTPEMTDAAHMALRLYDRSNEDLQQAVEASSSVRRLRAIGHQDDIPFCLTQDRIPVLPIYADRRVTLHVTE